MLKLKVLYRFLSRIIPRFLEVALGLSWLFACFFGLIVCLFYFIFMIDNPSDMHTIGDGSVYTGGFFAFVFLTSAAIGIKREHLDPIWREEERKLIRLENQKDAIGGITEC